MHEPPDPDRFDAPRDPPHDAPHDDAAGGAPGRDLVPVPPVEVAPRRRAPFGFLLAAVVGLALALNVAPHLGARLLTPRMAPPTAFEHVQARPPEPEAPTGVLADVYDAARPSALRIEARCADGERAGALGVGSGFYVTPDGGVLTAYHVVENDAVGFCDVGYVGIEADGDEVALDLVGFDAYFDLAWMKAATDAKVDPIPLADAAPGRGDGVVAIGNSRGDVLAARAGRVVRLGVEASRADFADDTIEMTAALAPGDSGGPVLDEDGEAVGVVSYISFAAEGTSGDGYVPPFLRGLDLPSGFASYAVPVGASSDLVAAIAAGESRDVPVIGFSWRPGFDYVPGDDSRAFGRRPGPIVLQVQPGGPAEAAGLRSFEETPVYGPEGDVVDVERSGDVIVAVDGEATPTFYDLLAVIRGKTIGEPVDLTVQRGRTTVRLELELGAKRDVFGAAR